ncbi:SCP-like protein [Ancylostoma duodenale]|uniref:SCP-like protein n=1 Tax=Ancylostoma duodenale TaxID=51022 RepID=A0A0C2HD66_9BILA|nr:SCP-like protein [Ancylostoma duodenale]
MEIYDCNIETTAMKHAKRCKFEHSPKEERPELGENVYTITAINMDKTNVAGMASKKWFGELEKFGVGQKNYFDLSLINRPKTQIDHYTQMVWQDSYKLGCYVEWCPTQTLAVCQYNPKGNMLKSYIYETGNPCKKDADCNCNCKCSVEEGLCIVQ